MNIQARTCANCCAFQPSTDGEPPMCQNAVSFVIAQGTPEEDRLAATPSDTCHEHRTVEEYEEVDNMLAVLKQAPPEIRIVLEQFIEQALAKGEHHPDAWAAWDQMAALDTTGHIAALGVKARDAERTRKHLEDASPEFLDAMSACLRLHESVGADHPESKKAVMLAMSMAPDTLIEEMREHAKELGLMPKQPDGYTADGMPVYNLETIAASLGITLEEAELELKKMLAVSDELGIESRLVDPASVHQVQ